MTVAGKVLAVGSGLSANGRWVFMKGREPVLVRDGGFSFDRVPATYDVWVANEDRGNISIYEGVTRRDPVLWHSTYYMPGLDEAPQRGTITGILRGDFPFPVELGYLVTIYYVAEGAQAVIQVGRYSASGGPRFGPIAVEWYGGPSITGNLVAVAEHATKDKRWAKAFLASTPLSLTSGEKATAELKLAPVPTGRIAGSIDTDGLDMVREIYFTYQVPKAKGQLDVLHCKVYKTYDCELPDLRSLGGEYCASINFAYPFGEPTVEARKCGGKIGMTDFSFHVGGPPRFQGKSATVSKDGVLAWTDKEKGVYMVKLGPDWHTPKAPHLEIFTSETQIRWPDFEALGVTLPVGAKFRCQVSRLSPWLKDSLGV